MLHRKAPALQKALGDVSRGELEGSLGVAAHPRTSHVGSHYIVPLHRLVLHRLCDARGLVRALREAVS
jgi:hypothetical protein